MVAKRFFLLTDHFSLCWGQNELRVSACFLRMRNPGLFSLQPGGFRFGELRGVEVNTSDCRLSWVSATQRIHFIILLWLNCVGYFATGVPQSCRTYDSTSSGWLTNAMVVNVEIMRVGRIRKHSDQVKRFHSPWGWKASNWSGVVMVVVVDLLEEQSLLLSWLEERRRFIRVSIPLVAWHS